ncbi:MAG: hypothetical protein DI640_10710 [Sphingomonas taxi]|uniref:Uncharacterized protein n=1 Tax=Sphingomonas taxi TaxID=1549858 RepID=A0A2W4YV20_9SPHN|nr:MAG: hypothetical protein DI640_10710 [Sphingomonas taxi]
MLGHFYPKHQPPDRHQPSPIELAPPPLAILPRQGEVAPEATEGEDTERGLSLTSPSVWQEPATSPWRGRIQ